MKRIVLFIAFVLSAYVSHTQNVFSTNNNQIIDVCGQVFIPRGVNYSLADDWNFPGNLNNGKELSNQIALANPNTVRIQWYVDYGQPSRPALTLEGLDSVISRFARNNIVSILELHDFTHIHTDTTAFNDQLLNWWLSPEILNLIDKHKSHLFLNVANEYGPALYPAPNYTLNPNYDTEVATWVTHYKNIISALRNGGIQVPIVIDAPNYGMDYQTVMDNATGFNNHDVLNNIIMSCHAYWGVTSSEMESIVNQLASLTVPVIFGEVGNVDFQCNTIQMNSFLTACQTNNMGWLAWTWNRDECAQRNMTANEPGNPSSTTDGQFSTLTAYGQTIVNNTAFGLANHAIKADFSCLLSIANQKEILASIYPNPVQSVLNIQINQPFNDLQVTIFDVNGKICLKSDTQQINISTLEKGVYFVKVNVDGKSQAFKIIK